MRTRTVRGLAAGTGVAAILLAGGAAAVAVPDSAEWEDEFAQQTGKDDVTCLVSMVNGADGVLALSVEDSTWEPLLEEGYEWVGLAIDVDTRFDVQEWQGYTTYEYGVDARSGANIDNAVICQAPAGDATPAAEVDEPADADGPSGPPVAGADDAAGGAGGEADADETDTDATADDSDTDDSDTDDAPTGPPVETDGPATPSGPNLGLVGGAALLVGGAGAAGWALRRRAGQH